MRRVEGTFMRAGIALALVIAGAMGISACSPATVATAPYFPGGSLNVIEEQEYPQDLAAVLLASLNSLTVHGLTAFAGGFNPVTPTTSCPVQSPLPLVFSKNDSIPTLDSATFAGTPCAIQVTDSSSVAYTGLLVLSDATPQTAGDNLNILLHNFEIVSSQSSRSIGASSTQTLAYEGNISDSESSGKLSQVFNDTLVESSSSYIGATTDTKLSNNWTGTFTFSGSAITGATSLPAGNFSISGTTALNNSTRNFTFTVTTVTPMSYSPTCTSAYHITSGSVKATATSTQPVATASIVFTFEGCESPTVSFTNS